MHKLLPFRQYSEKDVFNLAKLSLSGATLSNLKPGDTTFSSKNWSGTGVGISVPATPLATPATGTGSANTTLGGDDPTISANPYLGAIGSADQGYSMMEGNGYPQAPLTIDVGTASDLNWLGITLRPTLAFDENDEKLLYYNRKKEELQCVLPGETVPVATSGFFTLSVGTDGAIASLPTPGAGLTSAADGKFTAGVSAAGDVGTVIATGSNGGQSVMLVQFRKL